MTQNTENSMETTRVVGRPFPKGTSGNPGGRPRGLAACVRENTDGGAEIVELMVSVMRGDVIGGQVPRIRDMMDAATWLADRAFGKAVAQLETKSLNVDMGLMSSISIPFRRNPSAPSGVASACLRSVTAAWQTPAPCLQLGSTVDAMR